MNGGVLNEAYERFHRTGPEWGENHLANHGPMAVEVMVRRGRAAEVPTWVDGYARRLDDLPVSANPVTDLDWKNALGDGRRVSDWTVYFTRRLAERPWQEVLVKWWPRLLPAIAAGTTHGVIRVGHVVRVLLAGAEDPFTLGELAHGLAFWAACAQPIPVAGEHDDVLGLLSAIDNQDAAVGPDDARGLLTDLVTAATLHYLTHGHRHPVLLVHTATAPNAVLHILPVLPRELWRPTCSAIGAVTNSILATHAPGPTGDVVAPFEQPRQGPDAIAEILDRAIDHADEHVIKFTDTATEVYTRTGDARALAAAAHAATLIDRLAVSRRTTIHGKGSR